MRYHFWGFLVNEAGEPIENADITVKLAGTDTLACVYFDEYSSVNSCDANITSTDPQLQTINNGYYEFWIADSSEPHGYRYDQKFKIEWERVGIAKGMVDNVNILPSSEPIYPANLSACVSAGVDPSSVSTDMNKLVSDALVCQWNSHWRELTELDAHPHGLDYVDVNATDNIRNKIISNDLGWKWDHHVDSTVQNYNPSAGAPHDIHEVDLNSTDEVRNKLVSNKDMHELYVNMLRSYEQLISFQSFVYDPNIGWYVDIEHKLDTYYPHVTCYNNDTHEIEKMATIVYINRDTIRIVIETDTPVDIPATGVWVKISG